MKTIRDCIIIKEVSKDITIDGILKRYDTSDPIMYGEVIRGNDQLVDSLSTMVDSRDGIIVSFFRGNKTEYMGYYIVDRSSIIDVFSKKEFDAIN